MTDSIARNPFFEESGGVLHITLNRTQRPVRYGFQALPRAQVALGYLEIAQRRFRQSIPSLASR